MDSQMLLYWQAYEELVSTAEILKADFNPVYQFEDQFVDGAIIDIGCGQTSSLLRYAGDVGRRLIGIDNEEFQIARLRSRLIEITGVESDQWELIVRDLQHDPLPDGDYSMVVLYNILHFFSLPDCHDIVQKVNGNLVEGSLISVCVHSTKHHANNPANPDNNEYFKHYFTQSDLDELFPLQDFYKMYQADVERVSTKKDEEVAKLWGEKLIFDMNITNEQVKADIRRQANEKHLETDLICVYKKL